MGDELQDILLNAITSALQNECKSFLAGPLATRLASVETDSRFQYDPVARNIASEITKVADRNPNQIVTADQIQAFYKEIESLHPHTEFRTAFADLFPGPVVETPAATEVPEEVKRARHTFYEDERLPGEEVVEVEENQEFEPYTAPEFAIGAKFAPHLHKFAEAAITQELGQFGAGNVRVQHKTNGPDLMVYLAQFVSPTGKHQVVVPVQVQDDLIVLPEVFGKDDRVYDFTTAGFSAFENDNVRLAEIKAASATDLLRHAESIDAPRNPSALESFMNEGETVVMEDDDLDILGTSNSHGLEDIEASLQNAIMRKQSSHNNRTITAAAEVVTRELRKLGQHKSPVFAGDGNHGDLLFTAELTRNNRVAQVVIPVETQGETVLFPTHFITQDEAYQLDQTGVHSVFESHPENTVFDMKSTNLAEANYNTLRQTVYASTMKQEHNRAQEALDVIASKFGQEAHTAAMKDYQDWIVKAQSNPVAEPNITVDFGHNMSQDDWASALQREIEAVTEGKGITIAEELGTIEFEKYDDPGYQGSIMTNRIDGIELT